MNAEVISVGDELLAGSTVNTNTAFLSRELASLGFEVRRQQVVGDDRDDITDALSVAIKRSRLIVFTGGLGPTDDDLTKETVAKALGMNLVKNDEVMKQIEAYFSERSLPLSENNVKQAYVIDGCEILANPNGTAPGIFLKSRSQAIALLPGPPRELEPMFLNELAPRLKGLSGGYFCNVSLHVYGIGESALEARVKDILYGDNPSSALYAKTGQVHINIRAFADTQDRADRLAERKVKEFRHELGDLIYSENGDDLHEAVVRRFIEKGISVSLAESCTGGLMSSRITAVPGASEIFSYGITSYADWVKKHDLKVDAAILHRFTAVSSAAAAEMAKSARKSGNSTYGVGITGIAGPTNGAYLGKPVGLVYVAVADKRRVVVKQFNFGTMRSRENVRELSVLAAFDMLRRAEAGLAIEGAREFDLKVIADLDHEGEPVRLSSLAVKRGVAGALILGLIATGGTLGVNALRRQHDTNVYNELKTEYVNTGSDTLSVEGLRAENPDTVGWLYIDGIGVDSVVVSDRGDGYYRSHDFTGAQNNLGCLYTETSGPSNTVIYGSSFDPTQMLGPILSYSELGFLRENSLITYYTDSGADVYRIVSVMCLNGDESKGEVESFYSFGDFADEDAFREYIIELKMRSIFNIEIPIKYGDSFLTLVTDAPYWEGARFVVTARRVRDGESTETISTMFSSNAAALYPDEWYRINGSEPVTNVTYERDKWLNWITANAELSSNELIAATSLSPEGLFDGGSEITVEMNGEALTASPLEVASRMVAFEIGDTYEDEAIKAQAVACISSLRYTLWQSAVPSVEGAEASMRIKRLVSEVICMQMTYDGRPIDAKYFPLSSGRTNSSEEIFGEELDYLRTVESVYDSQVAGYSRMITYERAQLKATLEAYYGITIEDDGEASNIENWIVIESLTTGGYVKNVSIDGKITTTGLDLAECLSLRSANFSFRSTSDGSELVINTLGSGHGVGMSQGGANMYALRDGMSYEDILKHYYSGVTVEKFAW